MRQLRFISTDSCVNSNMAYWPTLECVNKAKKKKVFAHFWVITRQEGVSEDNRQKGGSWRKKIRWQKAKRRKAEQVKPQLYNREDVLDCFLLLGAAVVSVVETQCACVCVCVRISELMKAALCLWRTLRSHRVGWTNWGGRGGVRGGITHLSVVATVVATATVFSLKWNTQNCRNGHNRCSVRLFPAQKGVKVPAKSFCVFAICAKSPECGVGW